MIPLIDNEKASFLLFSLSEYIHINVDGFIDRNTEYPFKLRVSEHF